MTEEAKPPKHDVWRLVSRLAQVISVAKLLRSILIAVGVGTFVVPQDAGQKAPPAVLYHVQADNRA